MVERTPWYPGSVAPVRSGLYERDYAGTSCAGDGPIGLDYFQKTDIPRLAPGIWYITPEYNDAAYQELPWRGLIGED